MWVKEKTFSLSDRNLHCDPCQTTLSLHNNLLSDFFNGGQPSCMPNAGQDPAVPHTLRHPISKGGLGPFDGLWQIGVELLDYFACRRNRLSFLGGWQEISEGLERVMALCSLPSLVSREQRVLYWRAWDWQGPNTIHSNRIQSAAYGHLYRCYTTYNCVPLRLPFKVLPAGFYNIQGTSHPVTPAAY